MIYAFMSFPMIIGDALDATKELRGYLWEKLYTLYGLTV